MENKWLNIEKILPIIEQNPNISDLHLSSWECISYRLNWEIVKREDAWVMTTEWMEIILKQLFQWNPQRFEKFLWDKEADFAYVSRDNTAYRVNAFLKTGRIWIVMRKILKTPLKLEDIMLANIATSVRENILKKKKWLYLVTGPTWSGKSTSIVSMLQEINETRNENIITVEDPIEYVFKTDKCIISQREIWHDTWSFPNALRAAMRQDPDILFIWEIRDSETAAAVLELAETGHLVFSTLHTNSASNTISRFMGFFPSDIQDSVAERLWDALVWVQSQALVKTKDGENRVALFELMINNSSIKNNIKKKDINQLDNIIWTSNNYWMITMKQYAELLIQKWIIDKADVEWLYDLWLWNKNI